MSSLFYRLYPLLLLLTFPHLANAASNFPRGCEVTGYAFSNPYLVFNETGNQSYYLLQNRSNTRIALERFETSDAFMTPPLHAVFDPMNWGAFASDIKNFNFKCYQQIGTENKPVNCSEYLDVCQYPRAKFALSNMGNYWISFNKSQQEIIQDSVAKGIYLKW